MLRIVPHTVPRVGRSYAHSDWQEMPPAFLSVDMDSEDEDSLTDTQRLVHNSPPSERELFIDNLLVRHRDDLVDRPRAMGV